MKNEEKIDLYLQIWDLCETINEGLVYLTKNFGDKNVSADVSDGIDALKSLMVGEKLLSNEKYEMYGKVQALFSSPSPDFNELLENAQAFYNSTVEIIVNSLLDLMNGVMYVSEYDTAKRLFQLCGRIPRSNLSVQLTLKVCEKTAVSAPKESFEHTLKLFEEIPTIFSQSKIAHRDYVYRPSKQRTFEKCPICGGSGKPFYRSFSFMMSDFGYPHLPVKLWMKCGKCENLYTYMFPEEVIAPEVLNENVLPNPDNFLIPIDSANGTLAIWSNILNKLSSYADGKTLLEVGIGHGELLAVALEMNYDVNAVEIVKSEAQKTADILGMPIWNGDFLNYKSDKTYSIIIMGDVIEHVTNPEQALRKAYGLLEDNGALWLSTPNFESSFSRLTKFKDPMWLEPYHITYFSYRGLEKLIRKCGFEVREYAVSDRYNGSMELILTKEKK